MGTDPPILLKVEGEVGGHDLTPSIAHEAGCIEFAHKGVHDWHSCLAPLPFVDQGQVSLCPLWLRLDTQTGFLEHFVTIIAAVKSIEVSDSQVVEEQCY